jgi:hypothetical protein
MKAVMKMFFVMGITWIADVLTWGLQWALGSNKIKIVRTFTKPSNIRLFLYRVCTDFD